MPDSLPNTGSADYPLNSTFLGFDYSRNKIGIAVGQRLTGTARPLMTLKSHQKKINWSAIEKMLQQWHPVALIVGLPLTMDGEQQQTTQ